jgi:hypothetical protein
MALDSMSLTSTVEWGLSLPPTEALAALRSGLERMGAAVSAPNQDHVEAETHRSLRDNRPAARWRITAEPLLEGSKVTIAVEARSRHSVVLDELARQLGQTIVFRGAQLSAWGLAKQNGAEASERHREKFSEKHRTRQEIADLVDGRIVTLSENPGQHDAPHRRASINGHMDASENVDFAKLHQKTQSAIRENLADGECVQVVIKGINPCVIVGTNRRAFLFKKGVLSGATFGHKLVSFEYQNITGVEVHVGAMTGAMVIHVPGAASISTSYWGQGKADPWKAYNAMPIGRPIGPVEKGAARLRELIAKAQNAPVGNAGAEPVSTQSESLEALKKMGELRDAGVVTSEEFEAKKAELLRRV